MLVAHADTLLIIYLLHNVFNLLISTWKSFC